MSKAPENPFPKVLKNQEEKNMAFEQYKILFDSLNKLNDTRESANNFWIGFNGLGVSALAYLRDSQSIATHHKPFLLSALILMGLVGCIFWLSYLLTIKKSIEIRNKLLVELEVHFPAPVFSKVFSLSHQKPSKSPLTLKEMIVPSLFLAGYLFFAFLLLYFPYEVILPPCP